MLFIVLLFVIFYVASVCIWFSVLAYNKNNDYNKQVLLYL